MAFSNLTFSGLILPPTGCGDFIFLINFNSFNSPNKAFNMQPCFYVLIQGSVASECAAHIRSVFPVSFAMRKEQWEPSVVTSHAM